MREENSHPLNLFYYADEIRGHSIPKRRVLFFGKPDWLSSADVPTLLDQARQQIAMLPSRASKFSPLTSKQLTILRRSPLLTNARAVKEFTPLFLHFLPAARKYRNAEDFRDRIQIIEVICDTLPIEPEARQEIREQWLTLDPHLVLMYAHSLDAMRKKLMESLPWGPTKFTTQVTTEDMLNLLTMVLKHRDHPDYLLGREVSEPVERDDQIQGDNRAEEYPTLF